MSATDNQSKYPKRFRPLIRCANTHLLFVTGFGADSLPVNIIQGTHAQLVAFLALHMWTTTLGLPLLLGIVLFSKRVNRHPTFINLCVAFIIIGL